MASQAASVRWAAGFCPDWIVAERHQLELLGPPEHVGQDVQVMEQ
jgi:hypothetical protein